MLLAASHNSVYHPISFIPHIPSSAANTPVPSPTPAIGAAPLTAAPVLCAGLDPPEAVELGPPEVLAAAEPAIVLVLAPAEPDGELCAEQLVNGQSALDCTSCG